MRRIAEQRAVAASADGARETLEVTSQRFGSFSVPLDTLFVLDPGMVGFPKARRFVLLDAKPGSPFKWMLCVDEPELGFAVVDPAHFLPGYVAPLERAATALSCPLEEVALFALVTIPERPVEIFVNLLAPIVVDLRNRTGRQLVLDDPQLDPAYRIPLIAAPAAAPQP